MVPGLLATFPSVPPAMLFGSEKFSVVWGHIFSFRQYARNTVFPWKLLGTITCSAFIGAYFGASAIHALPVNWVRPVVIVLLGAMLIYTWFKPEFGAQNSEQPISSRDLLLGIVIGAGIGFYDGFFGPGAGTFLIFLFIRCFHFNFLRASACAKVANFATNAAALTFFIPHGQIIYALAIPMALAGILGAHVGAKLAVKGGSAWLRKVFLVVVLSLMGKLIFDAIRAV